MQTNRSLLLGVALLLIIGLGVWFAASDSGARTELSSEDSTLDFSDIPALTNHNQNQTNTMSDEQNPQENTVVTLKTNRGDISIELFLENTPVTAGNFLSLAKQGFYDGVKFHRVISGFMIQGGDPNSKTDDESSYGRGGPGYTIPDEFAPGLSNVTGTISMANAGPNTGGSQFFINTADNTFLDGKHAVFGRVVEGMDVVRAIESTETKPGDIPVEPVVISEIELSEN